MLHSIYAVILYRKNVKQTANEQDCQQGPQIDIAIPKTQPRKSSTPNGIYRQNKNYPESNIFNIYFRIYALPLDGHHLPTLQFEATAPPKAAFVMAPHDL